MQTSLSGNEAGRVKEFLSRELSIETNKLDIYLEAFTHSTLGTPNNQRLAFLGDRVFDLTVAEHLFEKHSDFDIGALDNERSRIHTGPNQGEMARKLGLLEPLILGKTYEGASREDLEQNDTIMAEVFEALIGAIYRDLGFEKTAGIFKTVSSAKVISLE